MSLTGEFNLCKAKQYTFLSISLYIYIYILKYQFSKIFFQYSLLIMKYKVAFVENLHHWFIKYHLPAKQTDSQIEMHMIQSIIASDQPNP